MEKYLPSEFLIGKFEPKWPPGLNHFISVFIFIYRKADNLASSVESLAKEIVAQGGDAITVGPAKPQSGEQAAASVPEVKLKKQPGGLSDMQIRESSWPKQVGNKK